MNCQACWVDPSVEKMVHLMQAVAGGLVLLVLLVSTHWWWRWP